MSLTIIPENGEGHYHKHHMSYIGNGLLYMFIHVSYSSRPENKVSSLFIIVKVTEKEREY